MPFLPRIPLPLLPLCIKAVRKASRGALRLHDVLTAVESDLASLLEPRDVRDLYPYRCRLCGEPADPDTWCTTCHPGRCFECGTSDPTGFCPAHRVLDKGRVN